MERKNRYLIKYKGVDHSIVYAHSKWEAIDREYNANVDPSVERKDITATQHRPSKYKSEAALRVEWKAWNEKCHPEDQIDWIEFYEEATNKKATW